MGRERCIRDGLRCSAEGGCREGEIKGVSMGLRPIAEDVGLFLGSLTWGSLGFFFLLVVLDKFYILGVGCCF